MPFYTELNTMLAKLHEATTKKVKQRCIIPKTLAGETEKRHVML